MWVGDTLNRRPPGALRQIHRKAVQERLQHGDVGAVVLHPFGSFADERCACVARVRYLTAQTSFEEALPMFRMVGTS
ncbi:hypothetical protein BH23ACT12_BH23ACT12_17170 [soil metagenome]